LDPRRWGADCAWRLTSVLRLSVRGRPSRLGRTWGGCHWQSDQHLAVDDSGGNDRLEGNFQNDILHGGNGNDEMQDNLGTNAFYGGPDNDLINAATNKRSDFIDCGPGSDVAIIDANDQTVNCESVRR
jgi:Ca2+-binding RTX toxin-like protein